MGEDTPRNNTASCDKPFLVTVISNSSSKINENGVIGQEMEGQGKWKGRGLRNNLQQQ